MSGTTLMLAMSPFGYPADYLLWCGLLVSIVAHTWCYFKFLPWRKWGRSRLLVGNTLVLACFLGFAALAAESYFRFMSVSTDAFGLSLPARRWFALHVKLNSLGCRDEEWSAAKPDGVRRIAFVGDSFTYGWGVERAEDRFTNRLQSRFDQRTPDRVQVMNVAKPGWGTADQVPAVEELLTGYGVDEIVLCYVLNDIEKTLVRSDAFDPTKPPEAWFFNPESSCLIDYLYWTLYVPRLPSVRGYHDWLMKGYSDEAAWRRQQEHLGAIIGHCKSKGVPLRVVLLPFLRTGSTAFDASGIHAKMRDFFAANGVETLDLLPAISDIPPDQLVVNRKDAHPNAAAHERFAEAIWQSLFKNAQ